MSNMPNMPNMPNMSNMSNMPIIPDMASWNYHYFPWLTDCRYNNIRVEDKREALKWHYVHDTNAYNKLMESYPDVYNIQGCLLARAWRKNFAFPAYVRRDGVAEYNFKDQALTTTNYDLLIEWDQQLEWVDMEAPNLPDNAYEVDICPEDRDYGYTFFGRAVIKGRLCHGQVRQDGILYLLTGNARMPLFRRFTFQILALK